MTRRDLLLAAGAASAFGAARRPNFVFLLADDLGASDLGCYGSSFYETPQLDRFARSALGFTQAYSACPVCSPTRTAIMTGKYPARVGLTDYLPGLQPKDKPLLSVEDLDELPLEETTLAEALRDAGYKTFHTGKWHLGNRPPVEHGFAAQLKSPPSKNPARDAATIEDALAFIGQSRSDPFFLYLCFTYPHTPVQAVAPHAERFRAKLAGMNYPEQRLGKERNGNTRLYQDNPEYASMLYAMDELAGRVFNRLDELKLSENTVVVFTSDNGGLCTHGNPSGGPTANPPFRSGKGWCYEGGIRVPLMIRAPGVTRAGSTCEVPVISTDFYPTILDLARLPQKPEQHRDGLSLAGLLRGGTKLNRDTLYWHYPHYHGSTWAPGAALRHGDWKLIEFYEEGRAELYHLRDDIGERNDLAARMPDLTGKLRAQLREWQEGVGAKMPQKNPAYKPTSA
ncbi:MAG: sulfatase [Bryobacteraceae bacterium]|nr:sulfatase [Bryobacteraceae bacterium]